MVDKNLKKQFADYDSDTAVTLKHGQGHLNWSELVDPKQDNNNAKFEKPRLKSVCEKANDKVFVKWGNMSIISRDLCGSKKYWYIHDLFDVLNNPTKFQINKIRKEET